VKWLITGGCGFIGTSLIKNLLEEGGHQIRVIDNLTVGTFKDLSKVCDYHLPGNSNVFSDVEVVVNSITGYGNVLKAAEGSDVIVHLAAMSGVRESVEKPKVWFENNVIGTHNVLEAARECGVGTVVMASSGACVGDTEPPITETILPEPISPYGATKICGEMLGHAYYHAYGMNTVSLRFSNVYGPLSTHKTSLVAKFIKYAFENKSFPIYGDGKQTRDFIYTEDLMEGIKAAVTADESGVFQLCTGVETSVNEVIKFLRDRLRNFGFSPQTFNMEEQVGDLKTNWADNSKAKEILDWEPKVKLGDGLSNTIDWFMEERRKKIDDPE